MDGALAPVDWDTAAGATWGTPAAVANLVASGRSIIGISSGGSKFFSEVGELYMSWGNCGTGYGTDLIVEDPDHEVWRYPDALPINPADDSITFYTVTAYGDVLWLFPAAPQVICLATVDYSPDYCLLTVELWSGRLALLWSYWSEPTNLTDAGRDLFVNVVWHAVAWRFVDNLETGDLSFWSSAAP